MISPNYQKSKFGFELKLYIKIIKTKCNNPLKKKTKYNKIFQMQFLKIKQHLKEQKINGIEVTKVIDLHCTAWKWGIVELRSSERETKK